MEIERRRHSQAGKQQYRKRRKERFKQILTQIPSQDKRNPEQNLRKAKAGKIHLQAGSHAAKILNMSLMSCSSIIGYRSAHRSMLTTKSKIRESSYDKKSLTFVPVSVDRKMIRFHNKTEVLGEGSYDKVVRGQLNGNIPVAVKIYKSDDISRIYREAQVYQDVQKERLHPNFPVYFGVSVSSKPFLLLTQVIGKDSSITFCRALREQLVSSLQQIIFVVLGVAKALLHLHSKRWLHNDLKKNNIVLSQLSDGNFQAIVIDFGKASKITESKVSALSLGTKHSRRKHLLWIAPEVAYGEPQTIQSDVYSFGYLLHDLFFPRRIEHLTNSATKEIYEHCIARRPEDRLDLMRVKLELARNMRLFSNFCQ